MANAVGLNLLTHRCSPLVGIWSTVATPVEVGGAKEQTKNKLRSISHSTSSFLVFYFHFQFWFYFSCFPPLACREPGVLLGRVGTPWRPHGEAPLRLRVHPRLRFGQKRVRGQTDFTFLNLAFHSSLLQKLAKSYYYYFFFNGWHE